MVLFPNTDITIYNKYFKPDDDIEHYQKSIIGEVDWQNKIIATEGDKGVTLSDSTLIFIDKLPNYIKPKKFLKLSDSERSNYLTLTPGDIIVKDKIDFELTGRKGNNLAALENEYDDVVKIVSVSEFTDHFEVTCN